MTDRQQTDSRSPQPAQERGRQRFWRLFPLVWLGYLFFPVKAFLSAPYTPGQLALAGLGLVVFLVTWVSIYTRRSWRWHQQLLLGGYLACLLLYAAGLGVIGYDSATFLVYAGAIVGFQGSLRVAGAGLGGVLLALALPGRLGFAPLGGLDFVQVVILSAVALYGNHAAHRQAIASIRLSQVQAEKERLAADAERERIARDLHDLLGHTLSVIVLKSELAGKLWERDPGRAAQEIGEVERISREALGEVRSAVRGYQGSGLSAELARSKLALDAAGVRLELDAEPLSLPPGVEYAMEMVLREAITNVMRHAQARRVTVRLGQQLGQQGFRFLLEIEDDGAGRGEVAEGTGLTSMRERVRAAGGQFGLGAGDRGSRGGGTTVHASFPARPAAQPAPLTGPVGA